MKESLLEYVTDRMENLKDKSFFFPLDYENKLQHQLDKHFTIESHPLLYRHTMGSKIANVIFEKLYSRIDFNKEQYISFIKDAFLHFYDYSRRYAINENIAKDAVTNNIALMSTFMTVIIRQVRF